jgi:hypothetical protein
VRFTVSCAGANQFLRSSNSFFAVQFHDIFTEWSYHRHLIKARGAQVLQRLVIKSSSLERQEPRRKTKATRGPKQRKPDMSEKAAPLACSIKDKKFKVAAPDRLVQAAVAANPDSPSGFQRSTNASAIAVTPLTGLVHCYWHGLQAIFDVEKTCLQMIAECNLSALEIWTKSCWFVPGTAVWFDMAGQTFAACVEMQKGMMDLTAEQGRSAAKIPQIWQQHSDKPSRRAPFELAVDTFECGMDLLFDTQEKFVEIAASPWRQKSRAKAA